MLCDSREESAAAGEPSTKWSDVVSDGWWYIDGSRQAGPRSLVELKGDLASLPNPDEILVWRDGLPEWTKASLVPELVVPQPLPSTIDGRKKRRRFAWSLRPSRRALFTACVLGVALVGSVGVWLDMQRTPIKVMPVQSPVPAQAPAGAVQPAPTNIGQLSPERERALQPKNSFTECNNCPEMVVVPAGAFMMGSLDNEQGRFSDESPQHRVTIAEPFAVSRFAVTFEEWDACVADGGCNGYKPEDNAWGRGRRPVINVSWDDTKTYLAWLSRKTGKPYRLLSEAEFEYAARAGGKLSYPWGDEIGSQNANCNGCGTHLDYKQTSPVGSFDANAFGLHDMAGNVWEWVGDCYQGNYTGVPTNGSEWTADDCTDRVVRGGSWNSNPRYLRSASRYWSATVERDGAVGFRVGRTLTP